jgi:hypothetical protein
LFSPIVGRAPASPPRRARSGEAFPNFSTPHPGALQGSAAVLQTSRSAWKGRGAAELAMRRVGCCCCGGWSYGHSRAPIAHLDCGGRATAATPLSHARHGLKNPTRFSRSKAPSPLRSADAVHSSPRPDEVTGVSGSRAKVGASRARGKGSRASLGGSGARVSGLAARLGGLLTKVFALRARRGGWPARLRGLRAKEKPLRARVFGSRARV